MGQLTRLREREGARMQIIQLSDSHIFADPSAEFHGRQPLRLLEAAAGYLSRTLEPGDLIIHTGDLSQDGTVDSYAHAKRALAPVTQKLLFCNGNHDERGPATDAFAVPNRAVGDGIDYVYETPSGERVLVVDSWNPSHAPAPQGYVTQPQLAWLQDELAAAERAQARMLVFIHHPPFPIGSPWFDVNMPIANGRMLHEAIARFRATVLAVFFGHVHAPLALLRDGLAYYGAPATSWQYRWSPWDVGPHPALEFPPAVRLIRVERNHLTTDILAVPPSGEAE